MSRSIRTAGISSADLNALNSWIAGSDDLVQLRSILGNIMASVNAASDVLSLNTISPNNKTVIKKAQQIAPDLQNLEALKTTISSVIPKVEGIKDYSQRLKPMIRRMAHAIELSSITPEQVQTIVDIASGKQFPAVFQRNDPIRTELLLQQQIYSFKNPQDRTKKVIQEVLQNACDAADKKHKQDPSVRAQIDISSWVHPDKEYMDVTIRDNGIGMDWAIVSQKFFNTCVSGKDEDVDAAGGFGIAKSIIQNSPAHGFTVETNGTHASKFDKNMYWATNGAYSPPPPKIEVTPSGTSLSLFGLTAIDDWNISYICQHYAIGDVDITLNGQAIEPLIKLKDAVALDSTFSQVSKTISKNDTEEEIANNIIADSLKADEEGKPKMTVSGQIIEGKTTVSFAIGKGQEWGSPMYVLLNGQYQFETDDRFPRCKLICLVTTTARPMDPDYPMNPSRQSLRSPIKEKVEFLANSFKQILEKISKNNLFQKGLNITVYNKTSKPISTDFNEESEEERKRRRELEMALQLETDEFEKEKEKALTPEEEEQKKREMAERVAAKAQATGADALATSMVKAVVEEMGGKDDWVETSRVIKDVSTPTAVMIQKNFTSQEIVDNNPDLMRSLAIMWHLVLRRVLKTASNLYSTYNSKKKNVIPGLIFSDECIAIYVPPERNTDPHIIGLNPLVVSSLVDPESLKSSKAKVDLKTDKLSERIDESSDMALADKLAILLHHEAIHEATHFLFPDSFASDQFHMWISKLESLCHDLYKANRDDVRKYLSGYKKENKRLMSLILKHKIPKDLPGGRSSAQVLGQADMKAIYDAHMAGLSFRAIELDPKFGLKFSGGNNAKRLFDKYMKMMQGSQNLASTRNWLNKQSTLRVRAWIKNQLN